MSHLLLFLLLLAQGNLESESVTHLPPNQTSIDTSCGGTRLDLINAPPTLHLPKLLPKSNDVGNLWVVKVHNLGPAAVTIEGTAHFAVLVPVGATVRIESTGVFYKLHY